MFLSNIPRIQHTKSGNFFLIAGPCIIEEESIAFDIASKILKITNKLNIPFIFKASYQKANRSRLDSFRGIGNEKSLEIIKKIGDNLKIPTLTDIHTPETAAIVSEYIDVLQIPAFLCRQTDLLIAAAKTNKTINIKKGQFLSPESMKYVVEKIQKQGNSNIIITERGSMFGYQDLVVDFRNIPIMKKLNFPVFLDITHSLQKPNQHDGVTGGDPNMIETIAKAGIATSIDGIFLETHPNPKKAKSDASNMLELSKLESLLEKLVNIRKAIK